MIYGSVQPSVLDLSGLAEGTVEFQFGSSDTYPAEGYGESWFIPEVIWDTEHPGVDVSVQVVDQDPGAYLLPPLPALLGQLSLTIYSELGSSVEVEGVETVASLAANPSPQCAILFPDLAEAECVNLEVKAGSSVALPALTQTVEGTDEACNWIVLSGGLRIYANHTEEDPAGEVSFGALTTVAGALDIEVLYQQVLPLPADFAGLTSAGSVRLNGIAGPVEFADLTSVGDFSCDWANNEVTAVVLTGLETVTGALRISGSGIESVSLPALREVENVAIFEVPLTSITLPQLARVNVSLSLRGASLGSVSLPVLTTGGQLLMEGDPLTSVNLPSLGAGGTLALIAQLFPQCRAYCTSVCQGFELLGCSCNTEDAYCNEPTDCGPC